MSTVVAQSTALGVASTGTYAELMRRSAAPDRVGWDLPPDGSELGFQVGDDVVDRRLEQIPVVGEPVAERSRGRPDPDRAGGEGIERGIQGGLQPFTPRSHHGESAFQLLVARIRNELFHISSCLFVHFVKSRRASRSNSM